MRRKTKFSIPGKKKGTRQLPKTGGEKEKNNNREHVVECLFLNVQDMSSTQRSLAHALFMQIDDTTFYTFDLIDGL